MNFDKISEIIQAGVSKLETYKFNVSTLLKDCSITKRDVEAAKEAQAISQKIAQEIQQRANQQIESVVARCIEFVFGEEAYQFSIEFVRKRGKTEAELYFYRDGEPLDPLEGTGGGVVDVAAFALRLSSILATRPPRRRLLVLDEPVKMLSKEYSDRFRQLLETLSEEMEIQFILITHNPKLATGKIIEIG